jgi:hypothetical protein
MSTNSTNTGNTDSVLYPGAASGDAAGRAVEPWFTVLVSGLVPLGVGLFAPDAWRMPLHVLGAVLCATGLVLLVRHEMDVRRQRNVTEQ